MINLSDDELMEKVKQHETAAFNLLYKRHGSAVFGYCMRTLSGNRAMVDDISQEVWLKVVRNAANYQARGQFKAWLMTIARNETINLLRKRIPSSDFKTEDGEEAEIASDFDLEATLFQAYDIEEARAAIQSLPDSQRLVFTIWAEEDASYDEICKRLNLEWNSVRALLCRAKQNLKKRLEKK